MSSDLIKSPESPKPSPKPSPKKQDDGLEELGDKGFNVTLEEPASFESDVEVVKQEEVIKDEFVKDEEEQEYTVEEMRQLMKEKKFSRNKERACKFAERCSRWTCDFNHPTSRLICKDGVKCQIFFKKGPDAAKHRLILHPSVDEMASGKLKEFKPFRKFEPRMPVACKYGSHCNRQSNMPDVTQPCKFSHPDTKSENIIFCSCGMKRTDVNNPQCPNTGKERGDRRERREKKHSPAPKTPVLDDAPVWGTSVGAEQSGSPTRSSSPGWGQDTERSESRGRGFSRGRGRGRGFNRGRGGRGSLSHNHDNRSGRGGHGYRGGRSRNHED